MTNNIKQYIFSATTPGSLGGGSAFTVGYTNYAINGEILSVSFKTNIAPGSIFLTESGTNQVLWGTKAGSSSLFVTQYPTVYPVDNTNTAVSGAGGIVVYRVVNGPLLFGGSAPDGGSISAVTVRYR